MVARALVTQPGSREAFLATLMLCSDGSRDVHGRAGTGDATWLSREALLAMLMLCSDGSRGVHGRAGSGDATWLEGSISGDADAVL